MHLRYKPHCTTVYCTIAKHTVPYLSFGVSQDETKCTLMLVLITVLLRMNLVKTCVTFFTKKVVFVFCGFWGNGKLLPNPLFILEMSRQISYSNTISSQCWDQISRYGLAFLLFYLGKKCLFSNFHQIHSLGRCTVLCFILSLSKMNAGAGRSGLAVKISVVLKPDS